MSLELLSQIRWFLNLETPIETFVDRYIDSYRTDRNNGSLLLVQDSVCEFLSSAFCVVDLYNPSESRREYEFDETRLRLVLQKLVDEHDIEF